MIPSERLARHFKESIEGTIELLSQQKEEAAGSRDVTVCRTHHSFPLSGDFMTEDFHEQKIILVGGFSSSDALKNRVKEEFPEVQVIQKTM